MNPKWTKGTIDFKLPITREIVQIDALLVTGTDFAIYKKTDKDHPLPWLMIHVPSKTDCGSSRTCHIAFHRVHRIHTLIANLPKENPFGSPETGEGIRRQCRYYAEQWVPEPNRVQQ